MSIHILQICKLLREKLKHMELSVVFIVLFFNSGAVVHALSSAYLF